MHVNLELAFCGWLTFIAYYVVRSMSILLWMKCTDGWLNCLQSHFWQATKSNEPTFDAHFMHFSLPLVHSDFSISSWIQASSASSFRKISVRPNTVGHSERICVVSLVNLAECASSKSSVDTFVMVVRHLRHFIWVFCDILRSWVLEKRKYREYRFFLRRIFKSTSSKTYKCVFYLEISQIFTFYCRS